MRFHPIIAIIFGYLVFLIFYVIAGLIQHGVNREIGDVLVFISFVIGGFIATYFAKETKLRYGIYEGIFIIVITDLASIGLPSVSLDVPAIVIGIILAVVGGILGVKSRKTIKQNTIAKKHN